MDRFRLAPTVGLLACLGYLGVLSVPLTAPSGSVYYSSGVLNPLLGGLFVIVTVIALAAGRQHRTDPALAAGVSLAFGVLIVFVSVAWAATARTDVPSIARLHRHALAGMALCIPLSAAWYARELGVW
ncbi:MAG: hypothetical protein ABEI98_02685 [Halorhabdus sp.]